MPGCFMSARRLIAAEVRFDENLAGYALGEDEDFAYRLSRRGRIRYIPDVAVVHEKFGFAASDARTFGRVVLRNHVYLLRKNFEPNARVWSQFAVLVVLLIAHRVVNRDWAGARGLLEGAIDAWRTPP